MRRFLIYDRFGDPRPAFGVTQQIAMKPFRVAAHNRASHRFQEARESIGNLECHAALDIADAPAPFHLKIGGWTEDALYYHRPRTRHNEQAILIFALKAEVAGKDAAIRQP